MVEPHADQEDDEIAIDVCRETASLNLMATPSSAVRVAISMNLQRPLAPEAEDESATPIEYSTRTTTSLGCINYQPEQIGYGRYPTMITHSEVY